MEVSFIFGKDFNNVFWKKKNKKNFDYWSP